MHGGSAQSAPRNSARTPGQLLASQSGTPATAAWIAAAPCAVGIRAKEAGSRGPAVIAPAPSPPLPRAPPPAAPPVPAVDPGSTWRTTGAAGSPPLRSGAATGAAAGAEGADD